MRMRTRELRTRKQDGTIDALNGQVDRLSLEPASLESTSGTAAHGQTSVSGHHFENIPVPAPAAPLVVSEREHPLEQEAERVAHRVVNGAGHSSDIARHENAPGLSISAGLVAAAAAARPTGNDVTALSPEASASVRATLSTGGTPLPHTVRERFEPLFGHDFGSVRVHTDDAASRSSLGINARAYTVGEDITFAPGKYAPGTHDGDRLLAHELTHVVQQTEAGNHGAEGAQTMVARDFQVPPKPVSMDAPAEREKEAFAEADKERARATVIAPIRAAAGRLGQGEKADVASVLRHLKPIRVAAAGLKWPESALEERNRALDELDIITTLLSSVKLSGREAVSGARRQWLEARRELAAAIAGLRKSRPDPKNSEAKEREGLTADINALVALSAQIEASIQDLVRAPRTQEAMKGVGDTAAQLLDQFDTIKLPEGALNQHVVFAKDSLTKGLATIAPLAMGKEETLKQAQTSLTGVADTFAALVGDAPPSADTGEGEPDPEDEKLKALPPNPSPAPAPSPNPLPPPPPPPPAPPK